MRNAYLELRSLTDAERAAELLHARRIPARAERLPAPRGCAFGVRVPAGSLETPSVAEERAFFHAKQNAAKQAAAYVQHYVNAAHGKITKERCFSVAWNSLREDRRSAVHRPRGW